MFCQNRLNSIIYADFLGIKAIFRLRRNSQRCGDEMLFVGQCRINGETRVREKCQSVHAIMLLFGRLWAQCSLTVFTYCIRQMAPLQRAKRRCRNTPRGKLGRTAGRPRGDLAGQTVALCLYLFDDIQSELSYSQLGPSLCNSVNVGMATSSCCGALAWKHENTAWKHCNTVTTNLPDMPINKFS